jgi:hypothetical protein
MQLKKEIMRQIHKTFNSAIFYFTICLFSFHPKYELSGQPPYNETYILLNAFFKQELKPYKLDISLLGFNNQSINFEEIINKSFFLKNSKTINIDTVLSETDFRKMRKQMRELKNVKRLDIEKLRSNKIDFIENFDKNKPIPNAESVFKICLPLFSHDKNKAVMYVENYCEGDCGGGYLYIFHRQKNGEWSVFKSIQVWIG